MANKIAKAYEMTDAKITFVSLVDKAANRKQFLITKAEDGKASFQTYGRILKADAEAHYVTGIVYEPMIEDTQGNYMTEEEITKAAHWFAKNGNSVDLQHSFEPLQGAAVVESSVAKCDYELDGEPIKKGTWLMTVEITDSDVFEAIEKGEITGFSMGGVGQYSVEDVDISKAAGDKESKSILKKLAGLLGRDVIEKGKVKENYLDRITSENFWQAFYALQDTLFRWDWYADKRVVEPDPEAIREALTDFNEIVTELLSQPEGVAKSVEGICKAGKKMSNANKETLKGIHESLGSFLSKFEDEEEEVEVTKAELEEIVKSAVAECMRQQDTPPAAPVAKGGKEPDVEPAEEKITKVDIEEMIDAAIRKATGEEEEPPADADPENISEVVAKAVSAAMEPFMQQAGLPTNLNNSNVQKAAEEHYLHGLL